MAINRRVTISGPPRLHVMRLAATIVAVTLFAGCAFSYRTLSNNAVGFNLALERAQNQVLLLNILRAMKRSPRYYTAITQLRGSLSRSIGAQVTFPFAAAANSAFAATPSTTIASAPSFDLAVLDSQKFVRGINTPISPTILKYLWDYHWPKELLLFLLVNEIRIEDPVTGQKILVRNYPADQVGFDNFKKIVAELAKLERGVSFEEGDAPAFGPQMPMGKVTLGGLAAAKEQKLSVQLDGEQIQFLLATKPVNMVCADCAGVLGALTLAKNTDPRLLRRLETAPIASAQVVGKAPLVSENQPVMRSAIPPAQAHEEKKVADEKAVKVELVLRSADAIVHYLGELAREEIEVGAPPPSVTIFNRGDTKIVPLFTIRKGKVDVLTTNDIYVRYEGSTYYIPESEEEGGRSGTCLALVSNLLALNKESEDLPTTGTVTTTGVR